VFTDSAFTRTHHPNQKYIRSVEHLPLSKNL
jgi:hypothetical protein